MKKTQCDLILEYLESHDNKATLGDLLEAGVYSFSHKLTARISDLRKRGYDIRCEKGKTPSQNLYILTSMSADKYKFEGNEGVFNFG